ncbi:hypothetical protein HK405_009597, partial [Cladochytrium tenue]
MADRAYYGDYADDAAFARSRQAAARAYADHPAAAYEQPGAAVYPIAAARSSAYPRPNGGGAGGGVPTSPTVARRFEYTDRTGGGGPLSPSARAMSPSTYARSVRETYSPRLTATQDPLPIQPRYTSDSRDAGPASPYLRRMDVTLDSLGYRVPVRRGDEGDEPFRRLSQTSSAGGYAAAATAASASRSPHIPYEGPLSPLNRAGGYVRRDSSTTSETGDRDRLARLGPPLLSLDGSRTGEYRGHTSSIIPGSRYIPHDAHHPLFDQDLPRSDDGRAENLSLRYGRPDRNHDRAPPRPNAYDEMLGEALDVVLIGLATNGGAIGDTKMLPFPRVKWIAGSQGSSGRAGIDLGREEASAFAQRDRLVSPTSVLPGVPPASRRQYPQGQASSQASSSATNDDGGHPTLPSVLSQNSKLIQSILKRSATSDERARSTSDIPESATSAGDFAGRGSRDKRAGEPGNTLGESASTTPKSTGRGESAAATDKGSPRHVAEGEIPFSASRTLLGPSSDSLFNVSKTGSAAPSEAGAATARMVASGSSDSLSREIDALTSRVEELRRGVGATRDSVTEVGSSIASAVAAGTVSAADNHPDDD